MVDSDEAARRLGVKLPTLYAYVSRGLIASPAAGDGRRSLFDSGDLERLARRARGGRRVEARLATVVTAITQLRDDGPAYRGTPAVELAATRSFEEVARLLWGAGDVDPGGPETGPWTPVDLGAPPPGLATGDRLAWAVVMTAARDPFRADRRPEAVARAARRLIATMVEMVPVRAPAPVVPPVEDSTFAYAGVTLGPGALARRLAERLAPGAPPDLGRAVNAVLVLMADHELATSTVAVRVAASTRADLYDAVLAGLATIAGPLHGGASGLAHSFLLEAERDGVEHAFSETLRWHDRVPGFGHAVYGAGDPRTAGILACVDRLAGNGQAALVHNVIELAARHGIPPPNVDLALAGLCYVTGIPAEAGQALFTLARVAGWTAHYLEELGEAPLRFRARAVYATVG